MPGVSPVDIANMALGRVGSSEFIGSLEERSQEANLCSLHYATVLDRTLEQFTWPFATRRAALAAVATTPNDDWAFSYALPDDCVCPLYIDVGARSFMYSQPCWFPDFRPNWLSQYAMRVPFQIEAGADGQTNVLLTDQASAVLVYTSRALPSSLYPSWFVQLLAWNLAAEIAGPLVKRTDAIQAAMQGAELAFRRASAYAANTGQADRPLDGDYVSGR